MRKDHLIYISGGNGSGSRPPGVVRPSKRGLLLAQRRQTVQLRFYDLGQVNHQALDVTPQWVDHPILKTPAYTTSAQTWGVNEFAGVDYDIEVFDDADYAAYSAMMFNYPVTEWTKRYRRINGIPGYGDTQASNDYRFDMRFSLRNSDYAVFDEKFMPQRLASLSFLGKEAFDLAKENNLTDHQHYWHNDQNYAGYRGLDQLTGQLFPRGGTTGNQRIAGGYFPYSNDDPYFKVTASNDFDAPAVDAFEPSGSYDIFLMPQIGLFLATANSPDWKTTQVLGLCYQVNPRYLWPRYVEPVSELGTGGTPGSDAAVAAWLEYQKGRSGVQASTWTYTGVPQTRDLSYIENPTPPGDWTSFSAWGSGVNAGTGELIYYSPQARGREVSDFFTQYATGIYPIDGTDDNFGSSLFRSYDPLLTAVIQKGSAFYYVWDISHDVEGFGNYTAHESNRQRTRYRIHRGINWKTGYVDDGGLIVRDGTDITYDY